METGRARALAGTALVGGGALTVLGFVTAEALYPGYSAADQTISALGAASAPAASQAAFNGTMILAGVLVVLTAPPPPPPPPPSRASARSRRRPARSTTSRR